MYLRKFKTSHFELSLKIKTLHTQIFQCSPKLISLLFAYLLKITKVANNNLNLVLYLTR